jgi:aminoglycoside 6'-N-acetyltransferase I
MIEIRELGEAHFADWAGQRKALWPEQPAGELALELRDFMADPVQAAFGAFDGNLLVGFAEVSERPWGEECLTRPVGWLEAIYVIPSHRRRGVGAMLVKAAEDWVRARGIREFGSDALIDNAASIAAHGAWGFAETQRTVSFRKELK